MPLPADRQHVLCVPAYQVAGPGGSKREHVHAREHRRACTAEPPHANAGNVRDAVAHADHVPVLHWHAARPCGDARRWGKPAMRDMRNSATEPHSQNVGHKNIAAKTSRFSACMPRVPEAGGTR